LRQGDRHRPVAHRPHPPLQPGHLYRRLHQHPRLVRAASRGAGPRLQARPLQLQRQGRPLRSLPGRRRAQDRDALPPRRLRDLRRLPRRPLQSRDSGGEVQGQVHRRRARHDRRGRGGILQGRPPHPRQDGNARRSGPRLCQGRPAGHDPVRRRSPARQARQGTLPPRHRQHPLHIGRAHHRPTFRRRPQTARSPPRPGRTGQQRGRDRAQPRRHQDRRLDHRHGTGGRRQGRRSRRRRHAGKSRKERTELHRALSRAVVGVGGCGGGVNVTVPAQNLKLICLLSSNPVVYFVLLYITFIWKSDAELN